MNFSNTSILKKLAVFAIVWMACIGGVKATHIVGGEMTYTCLGNDRYEVQLTIYRDCFYADSLAFFDSPAYIGVFNQNNVLVNNLQLPLLNNDTIPPVLNDPCLFVPADVCVHTTTYRGEIFLPFIEGGYQLAYERCCRNETILNIIDPLNAGAVYNTFITEQTMLTCNTAAKFTEWPPLFVCINEPIDWDHSAIDVDGDSLVYSLCTPLTGGSQARPHPIPTNNPPYDHIVWNDPAFGLENLLGGDPLTIDPQTGRVTAVPGVMGQFVVGICVGEYRDGEKISETRRDFQYNVGECGMVESTIVAPAVQCEDFSVSFVNNSQNADGYEWSFNDPNNPGASSTEAEPTYTYSEPGTYTIQLVASVRGACTDTSYHTIFLQRNSMNADFVVDIQECMETSTLVVTDRSEDPISNPSAWSWTVSQDGQVVQTSDQQNPTFMLPAPSSVELMLTTTSQNGCVDGSSRIFQTEINDPGAEVNTDIDLCVGALTEINPGASAAYTYLWEANPYFTDLTNGNPSVNLTEDAVLTVTISSLDGGCSNTKTVNLNMRDRVTALDNLPDSVLICENIPTSLSGNVNDQFEFLWSPSANIDDATSSVPVFSSDQTTTYQVTATNPLNGCQAQKSLRAVVPEKINLLVTDDVTTCGDDEVLLEAISTNGESYNWIQTNGASVGAQATVSVDPRTSAKYLVEVVDEFGCFITDSVNVNFIGIQGNIADDNLLTCNDEVQLSIADVSADSDNTYTWGPLESIISGEKSSNPIIFNNSNDPITFTVNITNANGCTVQDQVTVSNRFDLEDMNVNVDACADNSVDLNPEFNGLYDYSWGPTGILDNDTAPNPNYVPVEDQLFTVTITDSDGCATIRDVQVETIDLNEIVDISIESDTIVDGEETQLEVTYDPDYEYLWIPPTSLSSNTISNPVANPRETTNYSVMVINSQGCFATETITLHVLSAECDEPFIFFPNAFTPNGDGLNDVLRVRGNTLSEVRFIIYNRWGEKLFETNSIDGAWDGTYKGKQLPPDVYGYYLEAKCIYGGEYKKQGNVTILD